MTPRTAGRLFGLLGLLILPVSLAVVFLISCFKRGLDPLPTLQTEWQSWVLVWIAIQAFITLADYFSGPKAL